MNLDAVPEAGHSIAHIMSCVDPARIVFRTNDPVRQT
uniref:Transcriptional regulator n=1 Tax=Steinernema glaseri TaxID=37863 RepID=A0A1I7Z5C1_9BILA